MPTHSHTPTFPPTPADKPQAKPLRGFRENRLSHTTPYSNSFLGAHPGCSPYSNSFPAIMVFTRRLPSLKGMSMLYLSRPSFLACAKIQGKASNMAMRTLVSGKHTQSQRPKIQPESSLALVPFAPLPNFTHVHLVVRPWSG